MKGKLSAALSFLILFVISTLISTTSAAPKTVECRFIQAHWHYVNRTLKNCFLTNIEIVERGSLVSSTSDTLVERFELRFEWKVKFLPENIGEKFPNLISFEVRGCPLKSVEPNVFKNMRKLVYLSLDHNEIEFIPQSTFDSLPELVVLNLAWNKVEQLSLNLFKFLLNLKAIGLNGNQLRHLDGSLFTSLKNLEFVNLSGNRIETLPEDFFASNQKLVQVLMNGNRIGALSIKLFEDKKNLTNVDLRYNRCTHIDKSYWGGWNGWSKLFDNLQENLKSCQFVKIQKENVEDYMMIG